MLSTKETATEFDRRAFTKLLRGYLKRFPSESEELRDALADLRRRQRSRMSEAHFTASGIVIHPASRCILLLYRRDIGRWLQPGGHIKPGEPPWMAARREVEEEAGLLTMELDEWHSADGIPVDISTHWVLEGPHGQSCRHHDLRYLFRTSSTFITPSHAEHIEAVRWTPLKRLSSAAIPQDLDRTLRKLRDLQLVESHG